VAKTSQVVRASRTQKYKTRNFHRCGICGRRRGYYRKFRLCRICLRRLGHRGEIPGLMKASW